MEIYSHKVKQKLMKHIFGKVFDHIFKLAQQNILGLNWKLTTNMQLICIE